MYKVTLQGNGSFKAESLSHPQDTFTTEYWHVFQAELFHRLHNETEPTLRQTASPETSDKGST